MIYVLGWYNSDNIGDEAYKLAFPKLFPEHNFKFVKDLKGFDGEAIILGGGDVFNQAFLKKIKQFPDVKKYAFSVNVRENDESNFHLFERIIARNKYDNVETLPDFTLALEGNPERGKELLVKLFNNNKSELYENVVLVTANGYLRKREDKPTRDTITFEKNCYELAHTADNTNASFVFMPFGNSFPENDRITNSSVYTLCKWWKKNLLIYDKLSVQDTLDIYSAADAAICSRLHACIFSCLGGIPFIDLCHHTKTKYFTELIGRPELSLDYWHLDYCDMKNLLQSWLGDKFRYKNEMMAIRDALKSEFHSLHF